MSKHTPGPWHAIVGDNIPVVMANPHDDGEGFILAEVHSPLPNESDAKLIASSPTLLAALKTMVGMWPAYVTEANWDGHAAKAYSEAIDAIALAEGGGK